MGGPGSTRWQGKHTKDTVEGHLTLNIFKLCREGILAPRIHRVGVLAGGNSRMSFELKENQLTLDYTATKGAHVGQQLHYTIQIEETWPNFGGKRIWFRCPTCGRRSAKLHLVNLIFECRICNDLAYQVSREPTLRKLYAALLKQEQRYRG